MRDLIVKIVKRTEKDNVRRRLLFHWSPFEYLARFFAFTYPFLTIQRLTHGHIHNAKHKYREPINGPSDMRIRSHNFAQMRRKLTQN